MGKFGRPIQGIAFVAFLLLAPCAHAAESTAELEARYQQLFEKMFEKPSDLDVMYAYAETATALGRYDQAISTLERMLIFNPNLPRVRLDLGLLYLRIGSPVAAKAQFQKALETPDVPPAVRERAEGLIADADRAAARSVFFGSVLVGLRDQSNANVGPSSQYVLAQGATAILNPQYTAKHDVNTFLTGILQHRYDLGTPDGTTWESSLLGYVSRQWEQSQLDLDVAELRTGPRFKVGTLTDASVRPYLLGNAVRLDRELLFATVGVGLQGQAGITPRLSAAADGGLRRKMFNDTHQQPRGRDQTRTEGSLDASLSYLVTPWLAVRGAAGFERDDAVTEYNSNWQGVVSASVYVNYPAPLRFLGTTWQAWAGAERRETSYDGPDVAVSPTTTRNDSEIRLSLGNSFRLTRWLSLELLLQRTVVDSNLPNFDTRNDSVMVGTEFTF